jgi:hypothetical protein
MPARIKYGSSGGRRRGRFALGPGRAREARCRAPAAGPRIATEAVTPGGGSVGCCRCAAYVLGSGSRATRWGGACRYFYCSARAPARLRRASRLLAGWAGDPSPPQPSRRVAPPQRAPLRVGDPGFGGRAASLAVGGPQRLPARLRRGGVSRPFRARPCSPRKRRGPRDWQRLGAGVFRHGSRLPIFLAVELPATALGVLVAAGVAHAFLGRRKGARGA